MNRLRALLLAAAVAGALAGCGGSQPGAAGPATSGRPSARSRSPVSARPSPSIPVSPSAGAGAVVSLQATPQVAFTGDVVTMTVQALSAAGSSQWVRLASATVSLGDGTAATVTGRCAGSSLPAPSAGLTVRHVYQRTGVLSPQVTAATLCSQSAARPDLSGGATRLRVLAAAPAASTSWPRCGTTQIAVTATGIGAALGHIGVLFTLHNTSGTSCRLYGYPGLLLLGSNGQQLPTSVVRAATGAYMFPAVEPHWIALAPGASGSFDLQYSDNPAGSAANEPYATACPAATQVEVTLPNAYNHTVVAVSMAPCEGQVLVSPVVPGTQWLAS